MADILIRRATIDDYDTINQLNIDALEYHKNIRPDAFLNEQITKYNIDDFKNEITDEDKCWFVATLDGKICGAMLVYITACQFPEQIYCYIDTIFVSNYARGMGVGKALITEAEKFAQSNQVDMIKLNVWEGNPAFDFYKKQGYVVERYVLKRELGKKK